MTLVLDSSVAIAWAALDERDEAAETLIEQISDEGAKVTTLWPIEIANVLLKLERRGRLSRTSVDSALASLRALPIASDSLTISNIWEDALELARAHDLTVYDATYLELALRLDLPLATRDKQLRRAAEACGVAVLG